MIELKIHNQNINQRITSEDETGYRGYEWVQRSLQPRKKLGRTTKTVLSVERQVGCPNSFPVNSMG
jgi:hypothetical protein